MNNKKNQGRPKINWDLLTYDDFDLDRLDKVKKKQLNKIETLQKKLDKIDGLINRLQNQQEKYQLSKSPIENTLEKHSIELNKIFSKKDDRITLIRSEKSVRGKISYFGKTIWCHIGSNHKNGLVHKGKKIGSMTRAQLCDEFRHKVQIKIQTSWVNS